MTGASGPHRSPWLDAIRAVAIFMVLVFHIATRYPAETLDPVAHALWRYGYLGVDMFFPLSGFLITRFLLKAEDSNFVRTFFLRRIFRIMPLYYLAVLTFVVASLVTGINVETLDNLWAPLTFTTGWLLYYADPSVTPYQITWSLSVEEFAYVLFGLAALVLRRHWFVVFLVAATLGPIFLRGILVLSGHDHVYFLPPARIDAIALGGLLAWAMRRGLPAIQIAAALAAALFIISYTVPTVRPIFFVDAVAALTCLLIALFETHLTRWRPAWIAPVANIGFHSYFTYLFHYFVIYAVFALAEALGLPRPFWGVVAISLLGTHVAAMISWRFFEGPLIDFGHSIERRRTRPAAGF